MIIIQYNNTTRQLAHKHARDMCESAHRLGRQFFSYKDQRGNNEETAYLGKLAEVIIYEWLIKNNIKIIESPLDKLAYDSPSTNFDGDFTVATKGGRVKIELKTKSCNCTPLVSYDVSSTRISLSDIYAFSRIDDFGGNFWICGWLPTIMFKELSTYRAKGSFVRNSSDSQFKCLTNEYVVKINQLKPPSELIKILK